MELQASLLADIQGRLSACTCRPTACRWRRRRARDSCCPCSSELDDELECSRKSKLQRSAYGCQQRRQQTSSNKMNLKLSYFLTVITIPILVYLNSLNQESEKPKLFNSFFVHSQELGNTLGPRINTNANINNQDAFWARPRSAEQSQGERLEAIETSSGSGKF